VLGEGMDVVDAMAGVAVTDTTTWDPPLPWPELPLIDGSYLLMFYRVTTAPFRVVQARPIGASFRLDWWSGPSAVTPVSVQCTTNLATGPWTVVSSNNTSRTFTDPAAPAGGRSITWSFPEGAGVGGPARV